MNFLKKNRALATLFFTIFLDMLGLGMIIPITPFLFTDPTSPHYILGAGISIRTGYVLMGIVLSLFSLGMFVASPIMGEFSDKYGRRKLLLLSISGNAVGYALFAFGILIRSIPLIIFARTINGIMSGSIVVAQAAIADSTKPEDRAKNFGLIGAAFGLGMILGPFIGGRLADPTTVSWFSATTPFFFAAFLAIFNVLFIIFFFRETNRHMDMKRKLTLLKAVRNIEKAVSLKTMRPLFITNFLFQGGFAFYITFSGVFFIARFGFNEANIGNYFAFIGLWIIFTQAVVTRFTARYFSEKQILRNTILIVACAVFTITTLHDSRFLYLIAPFMAMAMGLSQANMMSLISRSADASVQGEILGINGSIAALANTLPPLLAGIVAASLSPHAPLVISALVISFSGLYFINHLRVLRIHHAASV
jgi:DHA1 family tetracycline resistance protein-like MFS transporter